MTCVYLNLVLSAKVLLSKLDSVRSWLFGCTSFVCTVLIWWRFTLVPWQIRLDYHQPIIGDINDAKYSHRKKVFKHFAAGFCLPRMWLSCCGPVHGPRRTELGDRGHSETETFNVGCQGERVVHGQAFGTFVRPMYVLWISILESRSYTMHPRLNHQYMHWEWVRTKGYTLSSYMTSYPVITLENHWVIPWITTMYGYWVLAIFSGSQPLGLWVDMAPIGNDQQTLFE